MAKNKLCCRIFPIILIVISFLVSLALWYFDGGIRSFSFLTNREEVFNFIGSGLFISLIPIGIFYWLNEKEKYQSKAKELSLLGFIPALLFLVYVVSV